MIRKVQPDLNIQREKMLERGWLCKNDVAKFIPCGTSMANKIFDLINKQVIAEGLINVDGVVSVKRVLKVIEKTPSEIHDDAAKERANKKNDVTNDDVKSETDLS